MFYNYKGFTSIVLVSLANGYCKFLFVGVGFNCRISDDGVLSLSDLMFVLETDYNFPEPKIIVNNRKLPNVIVADKSFLNGKHVNRLFCSRQNIERAYGILSNCFRVLQSQIQHNELNTPIILQACCVLHNFFKHKSKSYMDNTDLINRETGSSSQNAETSKRVTWTMTK